ncbi:DUF4438 domain-containing protein [Actinokineospora enzanensis]|uniref:DUF4438 family protein n=1 Tax=Actinokineospora enzanensis TaxID=155975 RepID=UPI00037466B1|nr:DUF4438 domain-containing protein [Actinokineospora enzanensis]
MNALVRTTLLGVVETPRLGATPHLVDRDGVPYVPTATGGVVLGLRLGDGVFDVDADHAAPGVTLVHPDPAACHALTAFACLGNTAVVRSGDARGATGRVLGKREGRVIVVYTQDVLARMVPGDQVAIHAHGQGAAGSLNVDPALLPALRGRSVRARVPSHLVGNGFGRPAHQWDLDLQVGPAEAAHWRLGDLVCIDDVDVRHNAGSREGWSTVAVLVHAGSPLPGHGPGAMPVLCGPTAGIDVRVDPDGHVGVTPDLLGCPGA